MDTSTPISSVSNEYSSSTSSSRPRDNKKKMFIIAIIVILLIGGFLWFRSTQESNNDDEATITPTADEERPTRRPTRRPTEKPDVTPTPRATTEPTRRPTPAEVTSAKQMSIEVLNGSGEAGVASGGQSHLTNKGYEFVEVGNAENFNYEGVTVRIKESRSDFGDTLVNDLKEKYDNVTRETLPENASVDAIVIIGK